MESRQTLSSHRLLNKKIRGSMLMMLAAGVPLVLAGCMERSQNRPSLVDRAVESSLQPLSGNAETTFETQLIAGPEGDPAGTGQAQVTMDAEEREVCYKIEVSNIADPTMAHIHRGGEGESGGVVIDFNTPENGLNGCVSEVEQSAIQEVLNEPANYYVNVHNVDFPAGAVRGQLSP